MLQLLSCMTKLALRWFSIKISAHSACHSYPIFITPLKIPAYVPEARPLPPSWGRDLVGFTWPVCYAMGLTPPLLCASTIKCVQFVQYTQDHYSTHSTVSGSLSKYCHKICCYQAMHQCFPMCISASQRALVLPNVHPTNKNLLVATQLAIQSFFFCCNPSEFLKTKVIAVLQLCSCTFIL